MDRSDNATLPFTIPCSLFKLSAKNLALANLDFGQGSASEQSTPWHVGMQESRSFYSCSIKIVQRNESLLSSMDSGLDAFSHNAIDGSFAPLAFQPSANANCLNLQFLSY